MKISFVIPCYRSEHTIEGVVSEIKEVVSKRPEVDFEIVMVSDHSPDGVYGVIERMCREDPGHLKGVELARNFGQPSALMAGFSRTTGDVVFSLDDDGQAPVDAIYRLVDKLMDGGYDVVYGSYPHKRHNSFRNVGSWVNHQMAVWLVGIPRGMYTTSFLAIRRFIVDEILRYSGPFPYLGGLIFRSTRNVSTVEVRHRERVSGTSGYTFAKLLRLWVNGFTAFSVAPLRLASYAGAICAVAGFCYGAWTIVRKLFLHPAVPMGYSSLMSAQLFIGGLILLVLGLIGEYVGRIYICINRSPQYVVARTTENLRAGDGEGRAHG